MHNKHVRTVELLYLLTGAAILHATPDRGVPKPTEGKESVPAHNLFHINRILNLYFVPN